jgi:ribosomal-protein-alanine N-acetyltransferase
MAFLDTIRNFFAFSSFEVIDEVIPAPPCDYSVHPLTIENLKDVLRVNVRCFVKGDNYTKYTFNYLLNEPRTLSYCVKTDKGDLIAFAFAMVNDNGSAHLTTIGVAPEHRRRGVATMLLGHVEKSLSKREVGTLMLEVRVGNIAAQQLYRDLGYTNVQRVAKYYNNGEDCFLMLKAIN